MKSNFGLEALKAQVAIDVELERQRQEKLWGIQRHDFNKWFSLVVEEVGEVAEALNRINFPEDAKKTDASNLYRELIQVSAITRAFAEHVKEREFNV
jgi:NTP pyrophosphatase (non-canonical NTP hydrolase)